jgi:hypothetical protein
MKMRDGLLSRILILFFFIAGSAWPQASNSTVRGTVRDSSQAVIPSAKVILVNTAMNVSRETRTNGVGNYVFPGVIPGLYHITAEAPGLQKFEGSLTVQVQQDATVDAVLAPAQASTSVVVQNVTSMVATDSTELGAILEQQRIDQLPINGRNYIQLLQTVPGVNTGSVISGNRVSQSSIVQAYGYRQNTVTTLFDGAQRNETYEGWDLLRPPGLDSISELHAETNASSAKFASPMTVVLSSKSGTNALHGSLFETNRNSGYGVARARQDNYTKPPFLNRNEYGASAGGPVIIPGIYNGRNRTFWFFGWEGERNQGATTTWATYPTDAMRNGDFSGLVDYTGRQSNIYNPFTTDPKTWQRQQFSYSGRLNTIDPSLESPTAKYLFSITPLPNVAGVNPLSGNNWLGPVTNIERSDTHSLRLDHRLSDMDQVFGRVEWDKYWRLYTSSGLGLPMLNGVAGANHQIAPEKSLALTWLHTFSPTMTNELLVSGSRQIYTRGMGDGVTNYSAILGLPNPFSTADWPNISTVMNVYGSAGGYFHQYVNYVNAQDNVTKIHGKHELQFGLQTRFEMVDMTPNGSYNGTDDFSTNATSLYDTTSTPQNPLAAPYTGYGIANMYLGVGNYAARFQRPWQHYRRQAYAPYFQDNWRVTSRLTLNAGLRYEMRGPLYDRDGTLLGFDLDQQAYVIGMDQTKFVQKNFSLPSILQSLQSYGGKIITNEQAGLPASSLVYTNWKKLGPRVGFAYRVLNERRPLVVRAGYRITFFPHPIAPLGNQLSSAPESASFLYSLTNTALSPDGLPNYGLRSVPSCIAGISAANCINVNNPYSLAPGSFNASYVLDPHYTDGKLMDWNYTVEKEVAENLLARVAYVGNWATNLPTLVDYNDATPAYIWYAAKRQPLPTGLYANVATRPYNQTVYGSINMYSSIDYSRHNNFQFELQRKYSQGLAFQVFYVLGKTMLTQNPVQGQNAYMPGAVPADVNARNRQLNYTLDSVEPQHSMRWNFAVDLPFGKGKKIAGNARGLVDKLIGGWQLAGLGSWYSTRWTLPTSIYPTGTPIETYGYKYPIQDCTSGACYPGYLWWNGYIPANRINSHDTNGKPNGIEGVPANYKPAGAPLIPYGSTAMPANAPAGTNLSSFWDSNTVWIPLDNGTVQRTTYGDNNHPWNNQYRPGPIQWSQDASLLKSVALTERVQIRFKIDFFNVFNHPNNPTGVSSLGVLATQNSGSTARVTQLTLRLIW